MNCCVSERLSTSSSDARLDLRFCAWQRCRAENRFRVSTLSRARVSPNYTELIALVPS